MFVRPIRKCFSATAVVLKPGAINYVAKGWTEPPQTRAYTHKMRRGQVRYLPESGIERQAFDVR
jgi:hypothetical protein